MTKKVPDQKGARRLLGLIGSGHLNSAVYLQITQGPLKCITSRKNEIKPRSPLPTSDSASLLRWADFATLIYRHYFSVYALDGQSDRTGLHLPGCGKHI